MEVPLTHGIDAIGACLFGSFEAFFGQMLCLWTRYFVGNLPQSFSWCTKFILNLAD